MQEEDTGTRVQFWYWAGRIRQMASVYTQYIWRFIILLVWMLLVWQSPNYMLKHLFYQVITLLMCKVQFQTNWIIWNVHLSGNVTGTKQFIDNESNSLIFSKVKFCLFVEFIVEKYRQQQKNSPFWDLHLLFGQDRQVRDCLEGIDICPG